MENKIGANYEEFEPLCKWQREEGRDTLVLHLQEFKKEQLKVQISNLRVLKISGERPLSSSKRTRFYKEIKVGKEYDANDIRAKFVNGLLYVVMPKTTTAAPEKEEAPSTPQQVEANKQPNVVTSPDDQATKMNESAEEKTLPSQLETYVPTKTYSNVGTKLALAITLASAIGVYIFYRYKAMYDGEIDDALCKVFKICKT